MNDDQDICLCFHVSVRKIKKFIRINRPVRESQLSECFGAGTGCGWCRPYLKLLFESRDDSGSANILNEISPQKYEADRREFRRRRS